MKTEEQFLQFYEGKLTPLLEELEVRRRMDMRWRYYSLAGVSFMTLTTYIFFHSFGLHWFWVLPFVLGWAWLAGWLYLRYFADKEINNDYKNSIVKSIIEFINPNFVYDPERHIPYEIFDESKIFMIKPDHYVGDDHVKGNFEGIQLEFSELDASYDSGKTKTNWLGKTVAKTNTVFRGLFFVGNVRSSVSAPIVILSNENHANFKGLKQTIFAYNFERGHRIETGDEEFDANFLIYAHHEDEGFQVAQSPIVENLKNFRSISSSPIHISYSKNKIFVALVYDRPLFEANFAKSLLKDDSPMQFFNDLAYALNSIKLLGLTNKTNA